MKTENTFKRIFSTTLISGMIMIVACSLLISCGNQDATLRVKKELLIYCGITMEKPIRELAEKFEQQENCTVKIMTEGSGTLYRTLTVNQTGDLYFPGSEAYIKKGRADGVITKTKLVGYNQAALIVAKGNPLGISPQLKNLTNKEIRTVLGSADSGSIGKETKRILTKYGLYKAALDNSLYLTSDSKGLRQAIKVGTADLTLNWAATASWQENREFMDVLPLADSIAAPHQLILSLLVYSKEPTLAQQLFDFIGSERGKQTFVNYGFGREQSF